MKLIGSIRVISIKSEKYAVSGCGTEIADKKAGGNAGAFNIFTLRKHRRKSWIPLKLQSSQAGKSAEFSNFPANLYFVHLLFE